MAQLLTRLKITEVSSVDKAANGEAKIVLMKRDDAADRRDHRERRPHVDKRIGSIFERYLGKRVNGVTRSGFADVVRCIIDLPDAAQQKRALLTTKAGLWLRGQFPSGTSLDEICDVLRTCRKGSTINTNKRSSTTMRTTRTITKADALAAIVKQHGAATLCKMLVDDGDAHGITEAELTKVITDSVEPRGNESRELAFVRVYCADNAAALTMRRAMQLAKMTVYIGDDVATMSMDRQGLPVRYPGRVIAEGRDALDMGGDGIETGEDEQDEAFDALDAEAEKRHKADPSLTKEQHFAKIYTSPQYRAIAERERTAGRAKLRKAHGIA
jgi:hypothetical protein